MCPGREAYDYSHIVQEEPRVLLLSAARVPWVRARGCAGELLGPTLQFHLI